MLYNMSYPQDQPGAAPAGQQHHVKPAAVAAAAASTRPRPRCSQPMPFDPEELSQKLAKVIADRNRYAERRRRARAEAAAASAGAATGAPPCPTSADHPPNASMARECLDKGSRKPGLRHSMMASIPRPRTEPAVAKPKPAPKERPETSRSKSKTPEDDRRSNKSKDSSKRKGSGDKPHYIPQFAASQFARTTTADGMPEGKGLVHKLSRTALRIAQAHRERHQQERKNFYSDRIPEMSETNGHHHQNDRAHRDRNHHRHTIEGAPGAGGQTDSHAKATRRVSTGDLLMTWDSGTSSPNPYGYDSPEAADHDPYEHRVDWTQSDEAPRQQEAQPQKSKPSLRKADSFWALKNKLGALAKHRQEEPHQHESRNGSPPSDTTLRSPKSGFFSRFKVNH
ncbi:hypothetical protein CPLU01_06928 [Colletotrichum plurivorum]|uniref:Uncharacterized protein n=1 Tax=Colletotrichum plurivorum TaxID=2175906 RepID=A0A8H6KHE3_9PEZI|nr:hypothetical protein CPLU01_06928 [Colletotrichum plurivorum]